MAEESPAVGMAADTAPVLEGHRAVHRAVGPVASVVHTSAHSHSQPAQTLRLVGQEKSLRLADRDSPVGQGRPGAQGKPVGSG